MIAKPFIIATRLAVLLALLASILASRPPDLVSQSPAWQTKVDSWVLETAEQSETEFLVMLQEQADLSGAERLRTKQEKGEYVYQQLTRTAELSQGPVLQALQAIAAESPARVDYRPFWIANMIWVRGDSPVVQALAQRVDVAHLFANPNIRLDPPLPAIAPLTPTEADDTIIEVSIQRIHAPEVWAMGLRGQGVVIGGQDTGYDWTHPALQDKYRGWNGSSADHNYNWHDAIHTGGGRCGPDSPVPCDDGYHGTHTMGTMVGEGYDAQGNLRQFGVAPGVKWIGCRNMNQGVGTPATYAECYQWFIAPTDLNGEYPRPDLAPDIINNSWSCPTSEGCTDPNVLLAVVNNLRAAGILTVHSGGNSGSACSTIRTPAAIYDASFTVGATDNNDIIATFSSRGPVAIDGSSRSKPDITAPGLNIYSTVPGGGFSYASGTSMAAPHVAGVAALLLSQRPDLRGQVDRIEDLIRREAVPRTTSQICGGVPGSQIPNNTYGWGRVDALGTITQSLLTIQKEPSWNYYDPGDIITYTLHTTNLRILDPIHNVRITDTLPINTTFITATLPHIYSDDRIVWEFPQLNAGQSQSVQLVVQVPLDAVDPIVNQGYLASSDEIHWASGPPVWVYLAHYLFFPIFAAPPR
jgi:serine protease AprX